MAEVAKSMWGEGGYLSEVRLSRVLYLSLSDIPIFLFSLHHIFYTYNSLRVSFSLTLLIPLFLFSSLSVTLTTLLCHFLVNSTRIKLHFTKVKLKFVRNTKINFRDIKYIFHARNINIYGQKNIKIQVNPLSCELVLFLRRFVVKEV